MGLSLYYSCLALGAIFAIGSFRAYSQNMKRNPKRLPLPPGPKGLPIIGNLLDMPVNDQWVVFGKWSKTYGDIMHLISSGNQSSFCVQREERRICWRRGPCFTPTGRACPCWPTDGIRLFFGTHALRCEVASQPSALPRALPCEHGIQIFPRAVSWSETFSPRFA
ncbi:hypothetical protein BD779DRAFT_800200 [Infundibulicybe gibba]|nr:hypothetical protein BD779DRAFT_800200 [Infundibulicybe gibba]